MADSWPLDSALVLLKLASSQEVGTALKREKYLSLMESAGFYLISFWYKREEAQKRFTVYWCSVLMATMFGGLLASAIAKMDGVRGLANWRWIFILEGIFTIVVGITSFFLISDFPDEARWLTEDERKFVIARAATNDKKTEITIRSISPFLADFKNLLGGIMYFCGSFDHS